MTDKKEPMKKRPRAKTLRLICTEDQIKQIVLPLVDFTAYCLSIEKHGELPELKSMVDSLMPAKRQLAILMANKLGFVVNPGDLNSILVTTVSHAGYFRLNVTDGTGFTAQQYNIIVDGSVEMPMVMKIIAVLRSQYPNETDEQISERAIKMTQKL